MNYSAATPDVPRPSPDGPTGHAATVYGVPEGWDALLLIRRRAEFAGPMLHVARDDARMARLAEALAFFAPEIEVLRFPAWDCLPYDRVSPNPILVAERITTLARLPERAAQPRIVLTTVNALVQRVPPRAAFRDASMVLAPGGDAPPDALARFLDANGYGRAGKLQRLVLRPVSEVPLDKDAVSRFRAGWRDVFGQDAAADPIYQAVSD